MTIGMWLGEATRELVEAGIASARLDAEIILAHTLKHPRTYLHAHLDEHLDARVEEIANARVDLRLDHVPIAYIIGHKEFYGRRFFVSPSVLIPRPESEEMIELLTAALPTTKSLFQETALKLVDVGTGSGCLGITAKLEHPECDVVLIDSSRAALVVAKKNAMALACPVETLQSNLLDAYPYQPDIVLANLPYVSKEWARSEDTAHEPTEALFADDDGLALIKKCFEQLSTRMQRGAVAIFEADPRQWDKIISFAHTHSFTLVKKLQFAASFTKS